MSTPKTKPHGDDVSKYIDSIQDPSRKQDCQTVMQMMQELTKEEPVMWGKSIVGFGRYEMTYANGKKGEWMLTAFSSRKQSLTLYIMSGIQHHEELLSKLGPHKTGKGCLYVKRLSDIDVDVLRELISESLQRMEKVRIR